MDRWLFEKRVRVLAGLFFASMGLAWAAHRLGDAAWMAPAWKLWGEEAPPRATLVVTGVLCLWGFWLRTSGEARLGRAVLMQGTTARLLDDGPFSRHRNPLYAGLWLFFTAASLLWLPAWGVLVVAPLFSWVLHRMTLHEETLLSAALGEPYVRYLQRVPRWWPRVVPVPPESTPVTPPAQAWLRAVLGNLGLLSLGLYRLAVGAGVPARPLGAVNVALVLTWLSILAVRRVRDARADEAGTKG